MNLSNSPIIRLCMADLLGSLEVGISRSVDATGRLRSQITRIDEFMVAQRQLEQPQYAHQYASGRPDKAAGVLPPSDVDQTTGIPATQWQAQSAEPYQYIGGVAGIDNNADQFLFHLPPELLEGLPWNSDFPQTFSNF
jgi:hypothetical protein